MRRKFETLKLMSLDSPLGEGLRYEFLELLGECAEKL